MSDTEAREKLASQSLNVLCDSSNFPRPARPALLGQNMRPLAEALADELIGRGWQPPARVVSTVEELYALPEQTVIRDHDGTVAENWDGTWFSTGGDRYWHETLALPATVLYEPKEDE